MSRHIKWSLLCALACVLAPQAAAEDLYERFREPPAQARPFMRWWWNGSCVSAGEIRRELDLMKAAGIGGIEINPIAMPQEAKTTADRALVWLSPQWNERVRVATVGAAQRGMIADLIVGTGWPFGGTFLPPEQTIEGITLNTIELQGPRVFESAVAKLLKPPKTPYEVPDKPAPELLFLRLFPAEARAADDNAPGG